jgi:hypothetical protein
MPVPLSVPPAFTMVWAEATVEPSTMSVPPFTIVDPV